MLNICSWDWLGRHLVSSKQIIYADDNGYDDDGDDDDDIDIDIIV